MNVPYLIKPIVCIVKLYLLWMAVLLIIADVTSSFTSSQVFPPLYLPIGPIA